MTRDSGWEEEARIIVASFGHPEGATTLPMVAAALERGLTPAFVSELLDSALAGNPSSGPLALHVLQFVKPRAATEIAVRHLAHRDTPADQVVPWWSVLRATARTEDIPALLDSFRGAPVERKYLWAGVLARIASDVALLDVDEARIRHVLRESGDPLSLQVWADTLGETP